MIKETDILVDMHTHTIFSEHAYSTILENINQAEKLGVKYIAITDHFYNKGDDEITRKNEITRLAYMQDEINEYEENVKIIGSAEFNLNQKVSNSAWKKFKNMKWRPIGLHTWHVDIINTDLDTLYGYFEESVEQFNCFCHIERELHKISNKKYGSELHPDICTFLTNVVDLAKANDIVLEVNEATLRRNECGAIERLEYWLKYAKELNCIISVGSDAHYAREVGRFPNTVRLLNELNYPKELIINCDEEKIRGLL